VAAAGRMLAELPWLWMRPNGMVTDIMQWSGLVHLEQAMQQGQGVIVLSPHLGCWEIGAQALAERYASQHGPVVVLFRPPRKAWLKPLVEKARHRPGLQPVPTNMAGVRQLIRSLRNGGCTAILPDQVPPQGQGVWAPFLGRPVYTMTLLPRLAQQTGATVLLCWCERLPKGRFRSHILPVTDACITDPQVTREQSATAMNRAIESIVKAHPEQYLWAYARSKQPRQDS